MHLVAGFLGIALLAVAVSDAVQTVVVARHAHRLPIITRLFYLLTWLPYAASAGLVRTEQRRARYLGVYGPLSLLLLLMLWAVSLIVAFALLQWSFGRGGASAWDLASDIYFSAATFFTLGPGAPENSVSKYVMVIEAGFGFTFLGLVIGYLPVLYQSFSTRELRILLLDARAGSPPSALQFVLRRGANPAKLEERLAEWETWAFDLLQSHLSYPMLAYYRSQHPNQSWLSALTTMVDVSALAMLSAEDDLRRQAQFTFAAGRHALVHTASLFRVQPCQPPKDRLPAEHFSHLCATVANAQSPLRAERLIEADLRQVRSSYEPHAQALAAYFRMDLPDWVPRESSSDNWEIPSWERWPLLANESRGGSDVVGR
jgi:hypothetical protein